MALIQTDNMEPGMVLAADVHNRLGRLMLQAGTHIEIKHIRVLKAWGVTEVKIEGSDQGEGEDLDSEELERVTEKARDLFFHTDLEHPAVAELFRLKIDSIIKGLEEIDGEAEGG
ncbi:MAG: hypothetical protein GY854_05920 [Deltaproteobacteria bacterium]|nr:hypothetical protein [Deltaproteobacteria bacterium]